MTSVSEVWPVAGGTVAQPVERQEAERPLRILILNQAFHPDVASTAQHASDLAVALAQRGHQVQALSSKRCYDNPQLRFAERETWKGVSIRRIPSFGFGKGAKWRRVADFGSYIANCFLHLMWMPRHDVVIALTTPPLISFLGALMVRLKGGHLVFWVMDLNPDEAIAAGWLKGSSFAARYLQKLLQYSLETSESVIALDRFMAERLLDKGIAAEKIAILPPWSHSEAVSYDAEGRADFRRTHGLTDKFVVMYSGNHSPCHPLTTLMLAARQLRDEPDVKFVFIGGGSEFKAVQRFSEEEGLKNTLLLPYQPLDTLSSSLSAADLHTVVMGEPFVGMVHPCKIYNILTLGTPVLYIGPEESHVTDLASGVHSDSWFYASRHGETLRVVEHIRTARNRWLLEVAEEKKVAGKFSQEALLKPHIAMVEAAAGVRR
ncbi:MAG: glycosyltransferase family 4 protein [Bryobacteraceae bacterium]|nr:glycosyltransferase family 4 protein [Bryobacteraceae bacterium]